GLVSGLGRAAGRKREELAHVSGNLELSEERDLVEEGGAREHFTARGAGRGEAKWHDGAGERERLRHSSAADSFAAVVCTARRHPGYLSSVRFLRSEVRSSWSCERLHREGR